MEGARKVSTFPTRLALSWCVLYSVLLTQLPVGAAENKCANDDVLLSWSPTDYDAKYPYTVDFSNDRWIHNSDRNTQPAECLTNLRVKPVGATPKVVSLRDFLVARRDDAEKAESGKDVLVMRNGANEGIVVDVGNSTQCLGTLAYVAAVAFDMEHWKMVHPFRLFSAAGTSIATWDDVLRSDNIVHLLVEGETWIWPGVEVGFTWRVNGFTLQTVALEPKVIVVHDFISEEETRAVIQEGERTLFRSPEKHYTDDPDQNYRTSETGTIDSKGPVASAVRKRAQRIGRLAEIEMVEPLQLLRYTKGKWYKKHRDAFPDPKFDLKELDMDGFNYPGEFVGWCSYWRHVLYAAVVEFNKTLTVQPQARPDHFGILQAAVQAYFSPGQNLWYPLHTNTKLQGLLFGLALENGLVPDDFRITSLSRFNQLIRENEEVLDKLIFPYLCKLLYPEGGDCRAEDMKYLGSLMSEDGLSSPSFKVEKNRIFTMLPYLSDVEEGGETVFPEAPGPGLFGRNTAKRQGMDSCHQGIHVPPIKGSAAFFYHLLPNMVIDELSSHGGCPPVRGIKYAMNIFCWNVNFQRGIQQYE